MNKAIYLLAITSIMFASCSKPSEQQAQAPQAVSVTTTEVGRAATVYYDKYPGTVIALQKVDLRSEVSGYIRQISFDEGEEVRKGEKLYTIDQSKYSAVRNQAEAAVNVAQANLNQAKRDAERYIALGEKDAIAKQQVDIAKTNLENARQQLAAARADLERAQTDLTYSTIVAPFDGVIGISNVRLGTYVVAGQTLINTISSFDPMGVDFEINETEISRFTALKKDKNVINDSSIFLTLPDQSKYEHPGKIAIIDRGINSQTGTIKVRLTFANPDDKLRDGMSVRVHVKNRNSGHNIIIPHKAITEQMGEFFVYVVIDGKAEQVKIETGQELGDQIVVRKGLEEGQTIVVEGIQRLRNGMPVQSASSNQSPVSGDKSTGEAAGTDS